MRRTAILILTLSFVVAAAPAADENWEQLPDGSMGREAEFRGVDGIAIAAYIRKPAGPGPFPVIVWMHGGKDSRQATINSARTQRPVRSQNHMTKQNQQDANGRVTTLRHR